MKNADLDAANKLELSGIKKSQRYAGQIKLKLNYLHNNILALAIFMRYSHRVYNNKEVIKNIKTRQSIDLE